MMFGMGKALQAFGVPIAKFLRSKWSQLNQKAKEYLGRFSNIKMPSYPSVQMNTYMQRTFGQLAEKGKDGFLQQFWKEFAQEWFQESAQMWLEASWFPGSSFIVGFMTVLFRKKSLPQAMLDNNVDISNASKQWNSAVITMRYDPNAVDSDVDTLSTELEQAGFVKQPDGSFVKSPSSTFPNSDLQEVIILEPTSQPYSMRGTWLSHFPGLWYDNDSWQYQIGGLDADAQQLLFDRLRQHYRVNHLPGGWFEAISGHEVVVFTTDVPSTGQLDIEQDTDTEHTQSPRDRVPWSESSAATQADTDGIDTTTDQQWDADSDTIAADATPSASHATSFDGDTEQELETDSTDQNIDNESSWDTIEGDTKSDVIDQDTDMDSDADLDVRNDISLEHDRNLESNYHSHARYDST